MPAVVAKDCRGYPLLDARRVKRHAELMLAEIGEAESELSVLLTDDASIERLNRRHRRKAQPTDVLAFPMDAGGPSPNGATRLLGDVAISLETALRQAKERGHGLAAEVTQLLAHGLLHLLGYDHRTDAEERTMNAAAERLVAAANRRSPRRRNLAPARARSRLTPRAR